MPLWRCGGHRLHAPLALFSIWPASFRLAARSGPQTTTSKPARLNASACGWVIPFALMTAPFAPSDAAKICGAIAAAGTFLLAMLRNVVALLQFQF